MPILPEIRAVKNLVKKAIGVTFDTITAGWYAAHGYPQIYTALSGGLPAWSGESVSTQTAMNHSVVWACNRIISESIGMIPMLMMQSSGNQKVHAEKHPAYGALKNAPNDELTAQNFSELLTSHCVLGGNGFSQIIRRSGVGTAIGFNPLPPEGVMPDREKTGQKRLVYVVKDGNSPDKTYTVTPGQPQDILHLRGIGWDGIRGYSVIQMARQSIGTAIAMERNVGRFYANGGRIPYILERTDRFKTDQERDQFRDEWSKTYSDPHLVPILSNGITYKQIGLSMADAQLIESRQFSIPEICRWFSISPHLVGDLSRATFSNIEQLALEFVKMTLGIWLTRWSQNLWRCVLTPEEKHQGYFFKHDLSALLRGDFQSRMAGYSTMLQNGMASINEVRDMEDWNPFDIEEANEPHIQLNLRDVSQPNAGQVVKVGALNQ